MGSYRNRSAIITALIEKRAVDFLVVLRLESSILDPNLQRGL